jgi:hypothetical protein
MRQRGNESKRQYLKSLRRQGINAALWQHSNMALSQYGNGGMQQHIYAETKQASVVEKMRL